MEFRVLTQSEHTISISQPGYIDQLLTKYDMTLYVLYSALDLQKLNSSTGNYSFYPAVGGKPNFD
jgi:hypothetical protein